MLDKIIDLITNDNYDKLTGYILKIANTAIQLFLGILIIIYSFQSFVFLFNEKEIFKNKIYIKYLKEYVEMANTFASSGNKVFLSLMSFGFVLILFSYIIWLAFHVIGEFLKLKSFFLGDLLVFISLGITFWSSIYWFILLIATHYLKYYLFALPIGIFGLYFFFRILWRLHRVGKK